MEIAEFAKTVRACMERAYEDADYDSHDHNRGVSTLGKAILRKLAWEHAKGEGLLRIATVNVCEGDSTINFWCRLCDDYSNNKLSNSDDGLFFYCQECGALWKIDAWWNYAFNSDWSGENDENDS